jgi:hypothetical protein
MPVLTNISIGAALATLLACGGAPTRSRVPAATENAVRTIEDQTVTSSALPRLRTEVKDPFRYLGRVPFTIRNIASGERFVFADLAGKQIRRMFVLQFEGFLPHSDEIYRYDFSQAREIAGFRWRTNAFAYAVADLEPASEAATMHRWLSAQGYVVPNVFLMYRFLTLGDERRRHELILFYQEGTSDRSWLDELEEETQRWQALATQLESRALNSFTVHPLPASGEGPPGSDG